jgi:hypothetical protein
MRVKQFARYNKVARAGLCPWDNRGKANSLQKNSEALQYCQSKSQYNQTKKKSFATLSFANEEIAML